MTYVITDACIDEKDHGCVDVCPVDCIYEGDDQLFIHPDECIDCGACVPTCPVEAIYADKNLPPEDAHSITKAETAFREQNLQTAPMRAEWESLSAT